MVVGGFYHCKETYIKWKKWFVFKFKKGFSCLNLHLAKNIFKLINEFVQWCVKNVPYFKKARRNPIDMSLKITMRHHIKIFHLDTLTWLECVGLSFNKEGSCVLRIYPIFVFLTQQGPCWFFFLLSTGKTPLFLVCFCFGSRIGTWHGWESLGYKCMFTKWLNG